MLTRALLSLTVLVLLPFISRQISLSAVLNAAQEHSGQYKAVSLRPLPSNQDHVNVPGRTQSRIVKNNSTEHPVVPASPSAIKVQPYHVSGMVYTVTTTQDAGVGSLRKAILDANANPGTDEIVFAIPASGVMVILPTSALPAITDPVVIDGTTQSGYAGKPLIEIDGSLAGPGANGLLIKSGNSTVRGLVINNFIANGMFQGFGIVLDSLGGNIIQANYIGTNATGDTARPNGGSGIGVFGMSSGNLIGDITPAGRNVISGNNYCGIQISPGSVGGNRIEGNYIGISATTWDTLGNLANGIYTDAANDTIGGNFLTGTNIIADNGWPGIAVDSNAHNTVIWGNSIGYVLGGYVTRGNHDAGIFIYGAQNVQIGDTTGQGRNLIAGNAKEGIRIHGTTATGNVIRGNYVGGSVNIGASSYFNTSGNLIGVSIENAPNNIIGGRSSGAGNIIALNATDGISITGIFASRNRVEGNSIGPSKGTTAGGNSGNGILIVDAPDNIIGGSDSLARNYISGNEMNGIAIQGESATGNVVRSNYIGISPTDPKPYWGNYMDGVFLMASHDTIGGDGSNDGNTIAYNYGAGIFNSTGDGNPLWRNSIYLNSGLGIDLAPRGFTPNDSLDADTGANDGQNFPILDSITFDYPISASIYGRMNSVPFGWYRLDFYKSDTCNPSWFGDGETWIGKGMVYCDETGSATFDILVLGAFTPNDYITATATDITNGSTSAFSRTLKMLDSDGDGLLDIWEEKGGGIDWNCDGKIDLDLWSMGANPLHKDIFVEVDRMQGFLTHPEALKEVEQAFHRVPNKYVNNPDGNDGINLHVQFDSTETPIPSEVFPDPPWTRFAQIKAANFGTSKERSDTNSNKYNILKAKVLVYRYCIFANRFAGNGNSGSSNEILGQAGIDFTVTLGSFNTVGGTEKQQAATFMHELGHTLGLRHGGSDEINYKPNYYSIMNYLFQFDVEPLTPGTWTLDYSPAALATLDETHLNEHLGFNAQPGDYDVVRIPYARPNGSVATTLLEPNTSIDFDGNGDSSGFSTSSWALNNVDKNDPQAPSLTLAGYADWPNLKYNFRGVMIPDATLHKTMEDTIPTEMNQSIYNDLQNLPAYGIVTPRSQWSQDTSGCTRIATGYYSDWYEQMIGNGDGGAIITWQHAWDNGNDSAWDIRAQRIDSLGRILWDNDGISVSHGEKAAWMPSIVSDGKNGAIITWEDQRLPHHWHGIYAQHIDSYGREQWTTNGVPVTVDTTLSTWLYPMSVSDGHGGAIITWYQSDGYHAQHIDSTGAREWADNGVLILPGVANGLYTSLISDGRGGAIALWHTLVIVNYSGIWTWYATRIDGAGSLPWGTSGIQLTPQGAGDASFIEDKNGGAVIAFTIDSTHTQYQKACFQRLMPDGSLRWSTSGVPIDTAKPAGTTNYNIVLDDRGNITIGWFNYTDQYGRSGNLMMQRLDTAGSVRWPLGGIRIASVSAISISSVPWCLVGTNAHQVLACYPTSKNENLVQYIDSTGVLSWSASGIPINNGPFQENSEIQGVADNGGGAIVMFSGSGSDYSRHIYAQRLNSGGGLGSGILTAVRTKKSPLPMEFKLQQNYPNPFNPRTTIEYQLPVASKVSLKIYNVLGQVVATLADGVMNPGYRSAHWNANNFASGIYFYRFEATSVANPSKRFTQVKKMLLIK